MMTNAQFCLLISKAVGPVYFPDSKNSFCSLMALNREMIAETQSYILRSDDVLKVYLKRKFLLRFTLAWYDVRP